MFSCVMLDFNFSHTPTMCCGEHGDKAVPFTVKTDFFEYLSTIGFEATIVIMEFDTRQPTDKPIEYPTGKNFVPWIVANSLPTLSLIHI